VQCIAQDKRLTIERFFMSEFHTPGVYVLSDAQVLATQAVGERALDIVEERYGSGYPQYVGGQNGGLAYHNRHHSEAVQEGSARMCDALGLTPAERAIGRMAAAAHDIVQLKARGVMEQESADWLEAETRYLGLLEPAIAIGILAIKGTEPLFENNRLTGQMASELWYPSKSAELVSKSVACADMGELHAAIGPLLGHELFKEIRGVAPANEPPLDSLVNFQRNQVILAEAYQYPLPAGDRVFGKLRAKVASYSNQVLNSLERGEIESWSELIARDQAFLRDNS
jgi:hypothetical protein